MENTTNKTLSIILIILVIIGGVLAWLVFGEGSGSTPIAGGDCSVDIAAAQEAAEGQMCTQQFQNMRCPHDESVVHGAQNGCIISELSSRGWEEAEMSREEGGETPQED